MAAVGSIVETAQTHRAIKSLSLAWTCDAAGNVSGIPSTIAISGEVLRFAFVPSGGGTAPTALYDVTLLDSSGVDLMDGKGADRSATLAEQVLTTARMAVDGPVTLIVTNAGNAKQGLVTVYYR